MAFEKQLQEKIANKTKPKGALGKIEHLAFHIGKVQQTLSPALSKPTVLVFAGDHGIAQEDVSAYPQEVTCQMVQNFTDGGAAINVCCRQHDLSLHIIDAGVNADLDSATGLIHRKIRKGTRSFLETQAMTGDQLHDCFSKSRQLVDQLHQDGCNIIGFGEMGISNTSSASMLMSYLANYPLEECVGTGTGLSDQQYQAKLSILKNAKAFHGPIDDPEQVLATFGGFEMAQMCGALLRAYERNMLLLIDGFIATSTFLAAYRINPNIIDNALFCHVSAEKGHHQLLQYLEADPILDLNIRLGEGVGCALAYPIINSAVAFLNEMANFDSASITNRPTQS
jgi:nicotinate-nucleotide--dimethylbenzimidazole phosphoribosyltransferase